MRALVDGGIRLQGRGQKTAASKMTGHSGTASKEYSMPIQVWIVLSFFVTCNVWGTGRLLVFSVKLFQSPRFCICNKVKKCHAAYLSSDVTVHPLQLRATLKNLFYFKNLFFTECAKLVVGYSHGFLVCNLQVISHPDWNSHSSMSFLHQPRLKKF